MTHKTTQANAPSSNLFQRERKIKKTHSNASGGDLSACGHAQAGVSAGWREACPPHNWWRVKLGEVVEVIGGGTPKTSVAEYWNGDIPWLSVADFNTGKKFVFDSEKKITDEGLKNSSTKLLDEGDIIISARGTVGVIAMLGLKMAFNQSCYGIKAKSSSTNDFVYYLLKAVVSDLQQNSYGGVFDTITRQTFDEVSFLLPPLPEQKAIAEVLGSIDDKIDLLHHQNKTLEDMAQALFRKWFIPARAGEPHAGGDEADEPACAGEPHADRGWKVGKLGDVIEIFDSKRVPLSKMQRDKMKEGKLYPYYGAAQIMDYVNDYIFDGEYILLGEDGTVRTSEGYPVLQYATGKFWVNNHTHILRAKTPYTNFFIWHFLLKKNINDIITGAVQPKISQTNLKSLDFPKFPLELVMRFQNNFSDTFQKILKNQSQIRTLENMRDTLLPKLMSGEARVKDFSK